MKVQSQGMRKTAFDAEANKMKNTTLISAALLSLAMNFAAAHDRDDRIARDDRITRDDRIARDDRITRDDHHCRGDSRWCVSAPEIDPAQAMGGLALLGGTIAIVRGYRRKKK
jgi:hypothetical protein